MQYKRVKKKTQWPFEIWIQTIKYNLTACDFPTNDRPI